MEITIETIASGWEQVVGLYRGDLPKRIATRNGISFDIPGLTIWISNPSDLAIPDNYEYPELVRDYIDRLFGGQRNESLVYQRLRRWTTGETAPLDQLDAIEGLLRRDRNTRSAVFSAWQPTEDLGSPYPISPVDGCFRIIEGTLILLLTARSTDVMVGLVPELIAWAQLISNMALDLGLRTSRIAYHCWSLHLYEIDYVSRFGR